MQQITSPRIVFMGSPEFALPSLEKLAAAFPVVGVVTQPDRPAGRGRKLTPPPVKILALAHGLPIIQPTRLQAPAAQAQLEAWAPDLIVVAAFGQILRPAVLDLPRCGCLNVHASLLPRWRGAAPIHAAILHGDRETGVTIMQMDPGLDTGPILCQRSIPILPEDTTASLSPRLAASGAELLLDTLPGYLNGDITPRPQEEAGATYAGMIQKQAGRIDFTEPAAAIARRVRAFDPWPGTYTEREGQRLKILAAYALPGRAEPGREQVTPDGLPAYGTADGVLVLTRVQPAGKKPLTGREFLNGVQDWGQE